MQEKRRKDQIISEILILCRDDANKTRIVYQVNLNFKTINKYLNLLMEKGFLEVIQGNRAIYKTTPAGEQALKILLKAEAIYS